MTDPFGHEATDDPHYANERNFYKLEQWSEDDQHVVRMIYAGNSLDRAKAEFSAAIARRPRGRYLIRQRSRVLASWPRE